MKINGIEGLSSEQINEELQRGGKFVVYQYCISIIVMTFKRGSDIFFIREGESAFAKGIGYTILSLILGWWGFPWGPIYTISSVFNNCRGGKDVTEEVLNIINTSAQENIQSVS